MEINGEKVDDRLVQEETERLRPDYYRYMETRAPEKDPEALEKQLMDWARENVVERVLLRQAALEDPDPVPEEELKSLYGLLLT